MALDSEESNRSSLTTMIENMSLGDEDDNDLDLDTIDGFGTSIKRKIKKIMTCSSGLSIDEHRNAGSIRSQTSVSSSDFAENRTAFVTAELKPDPPDLEGDVYDFSHPKRGLAIIINNEDFSSCRDFDDRPGSAYDASSLFHSFKRLGFDILNYKDLPAWKMVEVLKTAAAKYDHENSDCFACAILSHGDETMSETERKNLGTTVRLDLLFGVDGRAVATKYVIELFNNANCPKLKNKPRLFFLQACRGSKLDSGQEILVRQPKYTPGVKPAHQRRDRRDGSDKLATGSESQTGSAGGAVEGVAEDHLDSSSHEGSSVDPPRYHNQTLDRTDAKPMSEEDFLEEEEPAGATGGGDNAEEDDTKEKTEEGCADAMDARGGRTEIPVSPAPLFRDFMVMYATPPGYFAWRRTTGAWFVQSLCKVLDSEHVRHRSLLRAMAMVASLVGQNYESQNPCKPSMHQKKTIPVVESMLVKDIFFKPKSVPR